MSLKWETDWENTDIDVQDPDVAAMFARAILERSFYFNIPDHDIKLRSFTVDWSEVSEYWRWLQEYADAIKLNYIVPGDPEFRTYKDLNYKWPPPNGWRRIFPRVISSLSEPGKAGQIARFEYSLPNYNWGHGASDPLTYHLSGWYFQHDGEKWNPCADEVRSPDIVKGRGKIVRGDYFGGHILNDIKTCIDTALTVVRDGKWSSKFEKNMRYVSRVLPQAQELDNDGYQRLAKQDALDRWPKAVPQYTTHDNFSRRLYYGLQNTPDIISNQILPVVFNMDKSLRLWEISPKIDHGDAVLEPALNGQGVRFRGPKSKTFGPPVQLTAYDPRLFQSGQLTYDQVATYVFDGEDKNKWIRVVRVWEPFPNIQYELKRKHFQPHDLNYLLRMMAVQYDGKLQLQAYDATYTTEKSRAVNYVNMYPTNFIGLIDSNQYNLITLKRTSVGTIQQPSSFTFAYDLVNYSTNPGGRRTEIFSGPSVYSETVSFDGGDGNGLITSFSAALVRVYAYPVAFAVIRTAEAGVKQRVDMYVQAENIPKFDSNNDPITTKYTRLPAQFVGSDWDFTGAKFSNLDPVPNHWSPTGFQGYTSVKLKTVHFFGIPGGFKYKKGYTGV